MCVFFWEILTRHGLGSLFSLTGPPRAGARADPAYPRANGQERQCDAHMPPPDVHGMAGPRGKSKKLKFLKNSQILQVEVLWLIFGSEICIKIILDCFVILLKHILLRRFRRRQKRFGTFAPFSKTRSRRDTRLVPLIPFP